MIKPVSSSLISRRRRTGRATGLCAALSALLLSAVSTLAQTWTFNGHTYQLTSAASDWQAAQAEAVAAGGHLVIIGSQAEQDFIMTTILPAAGLSSRPVWIGLTDQAAEAWFRWTNAEPLRFTKWAFDAPDTNIGGSKDHVALNWRHAVASGNTPGTWSDVPVSGTTGGGGTSDGPYFGIIEIGAAEPGAAVTTSWIGGSSTWETASNWTNGVPDSAAAAAYVDNGAGNNSVATIASNSNQSVGRLQIETGDTVSIASTGSITLSDAAFSGSGELLLNGTLQINGSTANSGSSHGLSGNKVINGSGKLQLGGPGRRPEVYNTTVNNATIEGAGMFGRPTNTSFYHPIYNNGLVHANVLNEPLTFHTKNSINTGTFKATNGGRLRFATGDLANSQGHIVADGAASVAEFDGVFTIDGGSIQALNGGLLRIGHAIWKDVIVSGPTIVDDLLDLRGTVTNNGTIAIPNGSRVEIRSGDSAVTVNGTGEIVLDAPADTTPELIDQGNSAFPAVEYTIQDQTVRGRGNVGYVSSGGSIDNVRVLNRGRFIADRPNELLHIDVRNFDNQNGGVLRAENGGILRLGISQALTNEGGTIEALGGGRVDASIARVLGGVVRNIGGFIPFDGMRLVNPGTGMRLEGLLTLGASNESQEAWLVGDIENRGTLRVAAGGTYSARLRISEAATPSVSLAGGGEIILGDPLTTNSLSAIFEDTTGASTTRTLTNVDNTIHGFGSLGDNAVKRLVLNNAALIAADVPGKTLAISLAAADNTSGTFRASNGGLLQLRAPAFDNVGGLLEALSGSAFTITAATEITGGLLRNNGGTFDIGNATLVNPGSGLTLEGPFVISNNTTSRVVGGITNKGSINVGSTGSATTLLIGRTGGLHAPFDGGGEVILGAAGSSSTTSNIFEDTSGNTELHNLTNVDNTFRGFGQIGRSDARQLAFINDGIVNADATGKTLSFLPRTITNSPGKMMKATGGGRLDLRPSQTLMNTGATLLAETGSAISLGSGTLIGGLVLSEIGGKIELPTLLTANGGVVFANAGTLEIGAAGGTRTFSGLANGGSSINNSGVITKLSTGDYSVQSPLDNSGAMDVQGGILRWRAGGTVANSNLSAAAGAQLWFQDTPFIFSGANNLSGAGLHALANSTFTLADAATTLNATNLNIGTLGPTVLSGPGKLTVSGALNILSQASTISAARIVTLPGSTSTINKANAALNFANGANWEHGGIVTISNTPALGGDATGLLKTLDDSEMRFSTLSTVNLPFDLAGDLFANNTAQVTFDQGGTFRNTAKLNPTNASPASEIRFLGSTKTYSVRGRENTLGGSGFVTFLGTNVRFEDPDASTSDDDPLLEGTARVALHGTNTVEGKGRLGTTGGFAFEGSLTINGTKLRSYAGSSSTWNATNGNITLQNGAILENDGLFTIGKAVGVWTGTDGTSFHNAENGRVVHNTNSTTNIGIDFENNGVLEFKQGTINFTKKFSGNGGLAASGGSKVNLSLMDTPGSLHPRLLETTGAGSQINVTLGANQVLSLNVNVNGGSMVAAGGLNMVAAGGMNMVAAGGGNMVAAGGMNMVAAGSGNIRATGVSSLINTNNMVAAGGGNIISHNGGVMVAAGGMNAEGSVTADGGTIRTEGAAGIVAAGAGNIISHNGGVMVAAGAGNIISHNGGVMVAAGAGNVRVEGTGQMVAAGGGNIISHNGGVMVAAGGGNMVAAGGMNINGGIAAAVASRFAASNAQRSNIAAAATVDSSTPQRDALMAYYDALNTDPNIGMITVEAGGSAMAQNGGAIVAESGGILTGAGTFSGPGLIKAGGAVIPGNSAGTLTWTGNLAFDSGSLLDIEIGGTLPGTQHDVLNVSGLCTFNGALSVRFVDGFGTSIQPTDIFDIVNTGNAITTALAGNRVAVSGTNGSFEVLLVNGGKTLRLANFVPGAVTFSGWASRYGLSGADAGWSADPNANGLPNLLEYALGLDPTAVGGSRGTTTGLVNVDGQKYLSLSYTKPTGADTPSDITYTPERATALAPANWSSSSIDLVTHSTVPGPGSLETVTVRSTHPMSTTAREFLQLKVTLSGP